MELPVLVPRNHPNAYGGTVHHRNRSVLGWIYNARNNPSPSAIGSLICKLGGVLVKAIQVIARKIERRMNAA
jgi:hypothetical protein